MNHAASRLVKRWALRFGVDSWLPTSERLPTLQERTGLMEGATPARSAIFVVRFLRSRFALRAKMFVIGNQFSGRSGEYLLFGVVHTPLWPLRSAGDLRRKG